MGTVKLSSVSLSTRSSCFIDLLLTGLSDQDEEPHATRDVEQQRYRVRRAAQYANYGVPYAQ